MSSSPNRLSLDDFKARLPLVDIVGRFVKLRRRGRGDHWGCCPFHGEKSPSFHVDETRGFYHCFGCGAHGNAIDFVMALENIEFPAALQRLEELTGIEAPRREETAETKANKGLYEANAAAARWFQAQLKGQAGQGARDYIAKRGLDAQVIQTFVLGYAPQGRDALRKALLAEGYTDATLIEAGLVVMREESRETVDRFRDRIVFPIEDARGRIVGFGGRAMGDAQPKYLNTAETPLFLKRTLLYGQSKLDKAVRDHGRLHVVEGYMDVIAMHRAGLASVAPLGTAMGEQQLERLWKIVDEPILCFDGDNAGLRAAARAAEMALPLLPAGKSLRLVLLAPGEDPDSIVQGRGVAALKDAVAAPSPLIDFLFRLKTAGRDVTTPERRAGLQRELRDLAGRIANKDVGRHYADAFGERLRQMWRPVRRFPGEGSRRDGQPAPGLGATLRHPSRSPDIDLLAPFLHFPELIASADEDLTRLDLDDAGCVRLRDAILALHAEHSHLDGTVVADHLRRGGFGPVLDGIAANIPGAWFARSEMTSSRVLEEWRSMVIRHQRAPAARRREALALQRALTERRDDEAAAQTKRLDRLRNHDEEMDVSEPE